MHSLNFSSCQIKHPCQEPSIAQNAPGNWLRKDFDTIEHAATRSYNTLSLKSVYLHDTFKMPIGGLKNYRSDATGLKTFPSDLPGLKVSTG